MVPLFGESTTQNVLVVVTLVSSAVSLVAVLFATVQLFRFRSALRREIAERTQQKAAGEAAPVVPNGRG